MIDYRTGDTRDVIATIPDGTVDLIASSPPFLALRSYLPADADSKHAEIGSEANPAAFLDVLLELTAEWGRVLAPHGSIAIELGDTYAGSGGAGGDYNEGGLRDGQGVFVGSARRNAGADIKNPGNTSRGTSAGGAWPRAKSLALIPQLYAIALAYGINPLTGQPSPAGRWLVRNMIVWHRPNPAVGALGDKFRPSTSYIIVATRSPKRWFDLTAVRTASGARSENTRDPDAKRGARDGGWHTLGPYDPSQTAGAPPLDAWFDSHDTWTITTQPSRLAHYAMWPPKLAERLILSMCPAEVCTVCGEPRRRIEVTTNAVGKAVASKAAIAAHPKYAGRTDIGDVNDDAPDMSERETLGWTDCGHDAYRPGVVLDPFAGTGTTLAVAELHGRDSIGIDLDPRNRDLLAPRMGECRKALFGTVPEIPGQLAIFEALT